MQIIVTDEWVYHYLKNKTEPDLSKKAFLFLKCIKSQGDRMVVVKNSKFLVKVYHLARENQEPFKQYSKQLMGMVGSTTTCVLLEEDELKPFPEECIKAVKNDDRYLIRAQLSVADSFILTSDSPLIEGLKPFPDIAIKHVDKFLDAYIKKCLEKEVG
jgi:hypothetical protein